jgi:hypothetical protein
MNRRNLKRDYPASAMTVEEIIRDDEFVEFDEPKECRLTFGDGRVVFRHVGLVGKEGMLYTQFENGYPAVAIQPGNIVECDGISLVMPKGHYDGDLLLEWAKRVNDADRYRPEDEMDIL